MIGCRRPRWRLDGQTIAAEEIVRTMEVDDDPKVGFLRVTFLHGTESCPPDSLMNHGDHDYLDTLSGQLEVQVGFARQILHPGDSGSATPGTRTAS